MTKIREYLSQFQCTGSECPDPCCSGWNVPVYNEDRERLLSLYPASELQNMIDDSSIPRMRTHNGRCVKQCGNGLCSVQAEFGHEILPNVCASYPRFRGIHKGGTELGAFLSCPEIVRLMLLHGDSLEDCHAEPRAVLDLDCSQNDSAYARDFLSVRGWFQERIEEANRVEELCTRIAFLVSLSPAFFHHKAGCWEDILSRPRFSIPEPTEQELLEQGTKAYTSFFACVRSFAKQGWPYPKPMALLQQSLEGEGIAIFPPEEWMMAYIRHDWNVRWYVHSPNLLFHWQSTLFKVLLIRLLYTQKKPQQNETECFVEAVYSTERLVEHTPLKRDLFLMYNQPWHFSQWISALLSPRTQDLLWTL